MNEEEHTRRTGIYIGYEKKIKGLTAQNAELLAALKGLLSPESVSDKAINNARAAIAKMEAGK